LQTTICILDRRKFIETLSILSLLPRELPINLFSSNNYEDIDWKAIKNLFPAKGDLVHLNSGSGGTMPLMVEDLVINALKEINRHAPYKIWSKGQTIMSLAKEGLGNLLDLPPNSFAINRNATDGINAIIFGFPLQSNEKILSATHDYTFVNNAIKQRCIKEGIQSTIIDLDLFSMSDEEIIGHYKNALTDDVKLLVLTLMTHREGRVLPVKKITDIARNKGISVFVDGAQALGHFEHSVTDLGCDFYIASLHKWLNAPLGTGFIYIKKEWVSRINPPLAYDEDPSNINKFTLVGTSPFHQWLGIIGAIEFLTLVPLKAKQKRLTFLSNHWITNLKSEIPELVSFGKYPNKNQFYGIQSFIPKSLESEKLSRLLFTKYNINVKVVRQPGRSSSVRISPNIFNTVAELDYFVEKVKYSLSL